MQGAEGCEGGCGGCPNVFRLRGPRVGSCKVAICKECPMVGRGRVEVLVQGLPGTDGRYQTGMLLQHDVINRPGFFLQTPASLIHSLILFLQIFTRPNKMFTTCHKSGVTCHVSCVTSSVRHQMLHVMCHIWHLIVLVKFKYETIFVFPFVSIPLWHARIVVCSTEI